MNIHDMRQDYDAKREAELRKSGWKILRFTNEDVAKNLEGVVVTIMNEIASRPNPPLTPPASGRGTVTVYDYEVTSHGFLLRRDGKSFKTPAGHPFVLPVKALADGVVAEWMAQGDKPKPETIPLTQLASTAIDIVGKKREEIVKSVAAYAESDLLCHRADEPPELAEQQAKSWQPWLEWAGKKYGAVLKAGQGVMPVAQPQKSLAALREAVTAYDDFHLVGLQQATSLTGSLVLGLALLNKQATVDVLFEAAELEALFQMQQWGEDPVTLERHASVRRDLGVCAKWFALLAE